MTSDNRCRANDSTVTVNAARIPRAQQLLAGPGDKSHDRASGHAGGQLRTEGRCEVGEFLSRCSTTLKVADRIGANHCSAWVEVNYPPAPKAGARGVP